MVKTDFRPLGVIFDLETRIFEHRKLVYGRRKPVYGIENPYMASETRIWTSKTHIQAVSGGGLRPLQPPLAPPVTQIEHVLEMFPWSVDMETIQHRRCHIYIYIYIYIYMYIYVYNTYIDTGWAGGLPGDRLNS